MANRHRGEIEARIGGATRRLRLTLGALADLETRFGADDLVDLARHFAAGRLKARDAAAVIAAGLRGAGEPVTDAEVAAMAVDGGAPAYADIVIRLIAATFGGDAPDGEGRAAEAESAPGERATGDGLPGDPVSGGGAPAEAARGGPFAGRPYGPAA